MGRSYRVGIIGCGKRARAHVPALLADERCKVVGLADVNIEAAAKMNADFGLDATVYTDRAELLAKEAPDVVVTCLWTPLHLPVFRDCVQAGVRAVLSEKPMAPTWGESLQIARLAEESGCLLTFCHQRRFAKGNIEARRLIEAGRFGKVLRMDLYSPPNLLDCGTHTFDQGLSLNRETPAKWALGAVDATKTLNWFNVPSEGMAAGIIVFQNGVRANIQVGGPDADMPTGVRVIGTEGFVEVAWDGQFGRALVYDDPAWKPPVIEDKVENHMLGVIRNALDCLESGEEPILSHKKALRAAEIIFALYESVRRHARVELPLEGVTENPFITMLQAGEFARGHKSCQ